MVPRELLGWPVSSQRMHRWEAWLCDRLDQDKCGYACEFPFPLYVLVYWICVGKQPVGTFPWLNSEYTNQSWSERTLHGHSVNLELSFKKKFI